MALSKQNRLRSSRDFGAVHRKGKRASTEHLAVRALAIKEFSAKELTRESAKELEPAAIAPKPIPKPLLKVSRQSVEAQPSALSSCFGISISKKVSKRAVVRNRIKRQLKAIIRQKMPDIYAGWQVVIVVRPSAVECDFADFLRELEYLLKKIKVLREAT